MENLTLKDVKDHFKYAKEIESALYGEIINLTDYDINSMVYVDGNYYVTHNEDLKVSDSSFAKRTKCIFSERKGFAKILTQI